MHDSNHQHLLARSLAWTLARSRALGALLLLCVPTAGCGGRANEPAFSPAELKAHGPGKYSLVPPRGETGPTDALGKPAELRVTDDFSGHPQTNDWWSSLLWSWDPKEKFSTPLFPHPLSVRSVSSGLQVGLPDRLVLSPDDYAYPHEADLVVGVVGLRAKESRVAAYSDWTVTNSWTDGARSLRATFGHGLPYVYVTDVRGDALVAPAKEGSSVTLIEGSTACFAVRTRPYCAFSPDGTSWEETPSGLVAKGAAFFSVAALPDDLAETRALFTEHAYAFVKGSRVTYAFEEKSGALEARYELDVDFKGPEGASPEPLQALYRHQVLLTKDELLEKTYPSPRGPMTLRAGRAFSTASSVASLLPILPRAGEGNTGRLRAFVKLVAGGQLFPQGAEGTRDSYWEGKSFGRATGALLIADQLGMESARDRILDGVKKELEDWFDGEAPRQYFYDERWHTLIGTPTMYHSGAMMNDHHFHYGYYIYAAAIVALFDREWAERWAPMVELLIRDAGSWDRKDPLFPFLRYFDVYAGHSWASGTVMGERGNNQESSAEDLNFAAGVALWGSVMERPQIRDTGLYLHTTLKSAVTEYWYDVGGAVYPKEFPHPAVGIVWGNGGAYTTWFSYQPVFIHGIQLTPMHAGMLFMSAHPKSVEQVVEHARTGNHGDIHLWRDMYFMFSALADPTEARRRFEADHHYAPEFGTSMAYVDHFLTQIEALGHLDASVTANTPHYAVFQKNGTKTHVAFNPTGAPLTVTFSDGTTVRAAPRSFALSPSPSQATRP